MLMFFLFFEKIFLFWTCSSVFAESISVYWLCLNLWNHCDINWFMTLFMTVLIDVWIILFIIFTDDCQCWLKCWSFSKTFQINLFVLFYSWWSHKVFNSIVMLKFCHLTLWELQYIEILLYKWLLILFVTKCEVIVLLFIFCQ